jgi:hypothetical protein
LAFGIDAALRLGFEFGLDAVKQLVEALGRASLGASHDTGRVVVHAGGWCALVGVDANMGCRYASRRALLRREQQSAVCDGVVWMPDGREAVVAQLGQAS